MRKYRWIYIFASIIVLIWGVRYFMNRPVQTEAARLVEFEDALNVSAVIVRNEKVYTANTGGSLQPQVFDETRVSKGTKIATIYTDGIDSSLKAELDGVNEKIAKLEAATSQEVVFGGDLTTIESRISASIDELVEASVSSDLSNLPVISKELSSLVGSGKAISGAKSPRQNALSELYKKRRELELSIDSGKKDIYSTSAGVYISGTDGCEMLLTPETVMSMGVGEFNALSLPKRAEPKDHYEPSQAVCKTVDNGIWYVAASAPAQNLSSLEKGDYVSVRMPELSGNAVSGKVEYLSEESDGLMLVVISSRNYIKGVYSERCVNLDIIKNNFKGLKIPVSAVRVEGEDTGVFVSTDGVARFRKINILYKDEESAIVEKSDKDGYLKLYDPVIVNGSGLEHGKMVN